MRPCTDCGKPKNHTGRLCWSCRDRQIVDEWECPLCHLTFPLTYIGKKKGTPVRHECRIKALMWRWNHRKTRTFTHCRVCDRWISYIGTDVRRTCSAECRVVYTRDNSKTATHIARAGGVGDPSITIARLIERDESICGICHQPVDITLAWPDPQCPTIDHIKGLAYGGSHTWRNVQLSHWQCNAHKRRIEAPRSQVLRRPDR